PACPAEARSAIRNDPDPTLTRPPRLDAAQASVEVADVILAHDPSPESGGAVAVRGCDCKPSYDRPWRARPIGRTRKRDTGDRRGPRGRPERVCCDRGKPALLYPRGPGTVTARRAPIEHSAVDPGTAPRLSGHVSALRGAVTRRGALHLVATCRSHIPGPDDGGRWLSRISQADAGIRTPDPFITSEVLYQLSYVGADVPR